MVRNGASPISSRSRVPCPNGRNRGQVLKLTTDNRARKIASKHQINWPEILPLTAIAKSQNEKIRRFREQQLERGYKTSKGISI